MTLYASIENRQKERDLQDEWQSSVAEENWQDWSSIAEMLPHRSDVRYIHTCMYARAYQNPHRAYLPSLRSLSMELKLSEE